jgi:hypothetical protein
VEFLRGINQDDLNLEEQRSGSCGDAVSFGIMTHVS